MNVDSSGKVSVSGKDIFIDGEKVAVLLGEEGTTSFERAKRILGDAYNTAYDEGYNDALDTIG